MQDHNVLAGAGNGEGRCARFAMKFDTVVLDTCDCPDMTLAAMNQPQTATKVNRKIGPPAERVMSSLNVTDRERRRGPVCKVPTDDLYHVQGKSR